MSKVVKLTPNDFYVKDGKLCTRVPGFLFVMYYDKKCNYCDNLFPVLDKVSVSSVEKCVYAVVDVRADNNKLLKMVETTQSPINYVPYFMLYNNGNPVAQYKHDETNVNANIDNIKRFITSSIVNVDDIPEYTTCIPFNLKQRVCYMEYETAYK